MANIFRKLWDEIDTKQNWLTNNTKVDYNNAVSYYL